MDNKTMTKTGERIKLERVKRSLTQEQLAERTSLSARTVQRIESGQEPSLATLRLLANALGIEVGDLNAASRRSHFRAPWSKTLRISTFAFFLALIAVAALGLWLNGRYLSGAEWLTGAIILGPIVMLALCLVFSVGGYSVQGGEICIHRMGWSTRYPLRDLSEVSVIPFAMMGAGKVFGCEGVFGSIGLFRNGIIGLFRAYVTDKEKTLVLGFGKKRVVVSPDDPEEMKRSIEAAVKELSEGE